MTEQLTDHKVRAIIEKIATSYESNHHQIRTLAEIILYLLDRNKALEDRVTHLEKNYPTPWRDHDRS